MSEKRVSGRTRYDQSHNLREFDVRYTVKLPAFKEHESAPTQGRSIAQEYFTVVYVHVISFPVKVSIA